MAEPRYRRLAMNFMLVLASTGVISVVIFGAGELYFRSSFGWDAGGQQPIWNVFDERRGWRLKPGEYSYVDLVVFRKVDVTINDLGLRNGPISLKVPDGMERISVIGDSFVFATPLNADDAPTGALQRLLGPTHEVVNIGVPGYGTGQEALLMEELISKGYEPGSKIVIVFFSNDIQDNLGLEYSTNQREAFRPAFNVSASGDLDVAPATQSERESSRRGWLQGSLFYHFLRSSAMYAAIGNPWMIDAAERLGVRVPLPRTPGIIAGWYSDGWPERWAHTEAVLSYAVGRIRKLTAAEIVLVYMPSPFQVEDVFRSMVASRAKTDARYHALHSDGDRPQRMLRQFAETHHVPLVDLTDLLRERTAGGLMFFPRDGHLTEIGSQRVAGELAKVLCGRTGPPCRQLARRTGEIPGRSASGRVEAVPVSAQSDSTVKEGSRR